MHFPPTLAVFFALLSFSFALAAAEQPGKNVWRVPLQRKSFITHTSSSPDPESRSFVTRTGNAAAGYDNVDLLKAQIAWIAAKYRATLTSYRAHTGTPHPLALAISEISTGVFATGERVRDVEATFPEGKLTKRHRKDTRLSPGLGSPIPLDHVPPSRHPKRNSNDISLTEVNSNMWMGTISVGTPRQNFTVNFDTGSADLILPSKACDTTCDGHTRYDPTASSTSVDLGKSFQISYSGGSNANGTQYGDNVYMGGYEAVNQTIGVATTYSSGMQSPTFRPDGLLGMGFSQISTLGASPVFQTMVSAGVVPQAVFGFALSSQSELTIGGTNTDMYRESTVEYVNVSLPAYWQIPFAGLTRPGLNNTPDVVVVSRTSYAQSIIDTGTTQIITTDSNAQAFYANVTGAESIGGGLWSAPCDIVGSLAPTLTYGSRNFTVSSSTFNLGPVSEGSGNCICGLAGGGSVYWIIGDVFLQNVYTIFDVGNTRVGFASLA